MFLRGLVYIFNTLDLDMVEELMCWKGKIANCKASGKNGIVFLLCRQERTYTIFYYVETEDEKYFNTSLLDRANLIAQFFKNKVYLK